MKGFITDNCNKHFNTVIARIERKICYNQIANRDQTPDE